MISCLASPAAAPRSARKPAPALPPSLSLSLLSHNPLSHQKPNCTTAHSPANCTHSVTDSVRVPITTFASIASFLHDAPNCSTFIYPRVFTFVFASLRLLLIQSSQCSFPHLCHHVVDASVYIHLIQLLTVQHRHSRNIFKVLESSPRRFVFRE